MYKKQYLNIVAPSESQLIYVYLLESFSKCLPIIQGIPTPFINKKTTRKPLLLPNIFYLVSFLIRI